MKVKGLIELLKSVDEDFDIVLVIENGRGGIGCKESVGVSIDEGSKELTFFGNEDLENWGGEDDDWIDD